ncbi:protein SENSITIVE TO UV 2 isoform X4 [Prunus dulcis]|uniref:protein SENSITIVE TO UV 2 isoform X4 n=1 Tax=Prunus dulcis TaxID=3755 RepID=UPI00148371E7|nr:protein SENSITIVE TO UV 2 isoform X4 [Prunus dulcis]
MSEERLEEDWDTDFLEQLIQVEEQALSSQHPKPPKPPPQPPNLLPSSSHSNPIRAITYSPPRELTQRSSSNGISHSAPPPPPPPPSSSSSCPELEKELEIARLKRELGHVSEKLLHLEKESSELRKENDKKDKQLRLVTSMNEKKDAAARNSESTNLSHGSRKSGDVLVNHEVSRQFQSAMCSSDQPGPRINADVRTSKATGVQTDEIGAVPQALSHDDLQTYDDLSKKLLAIWGSPNEQELGRNLICNLLMDCQTDFHFLFGCIGMKMSSKLTMDKLGDDSSSIAASKYHSQMSHTHTPEAEMVSHLYSVLTKAKSGMVKLEDLFQPLVNLCGLENCTLLRVNVMIEGLHCRNKIVNPHGSEGANKRALFCVNMDQMSYACSPGMKFSYPETQSKNGIWNNGIATLFSHIDWVSLFEVILQTAMKNSKPGVRLEAVSIMNMIIMRSNPFIEREKFGQTLVFETLSHLLTKAAGFEVRIQAVQLLYMLLNCPKILVKFCSYYKDGKGAGAMDGDVGDASAYQKYSMILQGLADCIACCGNGLQGLKLRRNSILLLAFLSSSEKSGFEILVGYKLYQDTNFLMLILQVLISEVDIEVAVNADHAQVFKERTLLMREALILLNRLVSNPTYSATVLRLLTKSRDMASLTIDVANRLSRKDQICDKFDGTARQMRESEIVDLARVFKKRVFTYLGDNLS